MALKGCVSKAGKALDVGDRDYIRGLIDQGRPDQEILNRLEQNILKERDDLVGLVEAQGLTVATAEASTESLGAPVTGEDATASAQVDGATKARETSAEAVESGVEGGFPPRESKPKGEAKPSQTAAPSTKTLKGGVGAPDILLRAFGVTAENRGEFSAVTFMKDNGVNQKDINVLADVIVALQKAVEDATFKTESIRQRFEKIFRIEDPQTTANYIIAMMSINGIRGEINTVLHNRKVNSVEFAKVREKIIKFNDWSKEDIKQFNDEINELKNEKRNLTQEEFDSFFADPTPEEVAAKLRKDSSSIVKFITKVAPASPLLAHYILNSRILSGVEGVTEEELREASLLINFEHPLMPGSGADAFSPEHDTVFISGKGFPDFPIPEGTVPDQRTLDLNNEADLKEQVTIVEHELVHAYTIPYIEKTMTAKKGSKEEIANINYIDRSIKELRTLHEKGKLTRLSPMALARVEYIIHQGSDQVAMAEFLAIMTAETDTANEIYKALTGSFPEKTLRSRIEALLTSIKEAFQALTRKQIAAEIDAETLQQAILNAFIMGKSMREQKADEFAMYRLSSVETVMRSQIAAAREQMIKQFGEGDPKKEAQFRKAFAEEDEIRELHKTDPEKAEKMQDDLEARIIKDGLALTGIGTGRLGLTGPFIKSAINPPSKSNVGTARKASFDYLNFAVASMLNSKLEREGKRLLGNVHNIMNDRFPIYTDVANKAVAIYDSSPALQQFVHAVTGENVNKVKKADVLSKFAEVNSQRVSIINEQVGTLTNLSKDLSKTEKADLATFVSDMPLHDYFVLAVGLTTAEEIEAEAELLRKQLIKINHRAVRDVDQLVDWNVGILNKETGQLEQTLGSTVYNLATKYPPGKEYPTEGFQRDLRKLLALESIKRIGSEKFEKLLRNEELMAVIKDNSVANVLSSMDNIGTENVRDSLIDDYWKEPFQIKAIHQKDFRMYEFGEDTGWKVLKAPTRTELGIVYKPTIDSTDIAGAYTDMKLISTDIDVGQNFKNFPGVVETRNGHKLLLTKEQKKELGLIEGFEQGLVRSTAHSIAMQESQIIRDLVLQDDTWMEIGKGSSTKKLEDIIESNNFDNPWFIKLEEGTVYGKLPASIRAKYQPVGARVSNVQGFNEKVDLVRKDISHWLLGGSAKSLFQNPQMRWAVRILKNLVSGAKIGMIVLNPVKIANDNLSNLTYLGVLGLNPKFIATNYAEIQKDFAEYTELQRQIFQLKLQLVARPESDALKKKLKGLQKRIAKNSVGDIGDKGFVNSLGSDLVSRSADTLSGFQADMHRSLEYLLTDRSGNKNVVSHFIIQLQKIGYQAEDFFGYLGDIAGKAKSTKLLEQELDQVANRLREIKSEEDIVNYVAQFTTSPSSEAVRFGSAMTDLTDVLAKETLWRHLTQNQGMSASDARIEVLDSFPDYKENMPLSIKALSDLGIIMFPSFWLRIQKIIYRMARDKPVGLATELMVQEAIGSDINTIFEANIINKSNTFGGLLHTPFEPVGLGSIVPMHVL